MAESVSIYKKSTTKGDGPMARRLPHGIKFYLHISRWLESILLNQPSRKAS